MSEQYNEDPRGGRQRLVQYFDKSRMEINNPNADQSQDFFVTNGLLTVELISGNIQVGEKDFTRFRPACIPMSGDFGDTLAPTYFAFQKVSSTEAGNNPSTDRRGQKVIETIDRNGTTGSDPSKIGVLGVEIVQYIPETRHNIPKVFWDFLNSSGPVHNATHQVSEQQLIVPWSYASGFPISEAFWTRATIRGVVQDVMIQAFQRRALTYVPSNRREFQVEMANIGQHYFDWRYRNAGICPAQGGATPTIAVTGTPAVTVTAGTANPTQTGTATPLRTSTATSTRGTPTVTPTPCPNCPTATPTGVRVPPGTIVNPTVVTPTPTRIGTPTP
jgi:hypothetical protein